MNRDLTGAYLRVKRDGEYEPIDISDMTEDEIRFSMTGREPENLIGWIVMLSKSIRELGDHFDIRKGMPDEEEAK
jgi:hypothetical protein